MKTDQKSFSTEQARESGGSIPIRVCRYLPYQYGERRCVICGRSREEHPQ